MSTGLFLVCVLGTWGFIQPVQARASLCTRSSGFRAHTALPIQIFAVIAKLQDWMRALGGAGGLNPNQLSCQISLRIQVTMSPGLPSGVPASSCYPAVIINIAQFSFQKCLALDEKGYDLSPYMSSSNVFVLFVFTRRYFSFLAIQVNLRRWIKRPSFSSGNPRIHIKM